MLREGVAAAGTPWQLHRYEPCHGSLFTRPATQYFFTDALPRDAVAEIVKGCR